MVDPRDRHLRGVSWPPGRGDVLAAMLDASVPVRRREAHSLTPAPGMGELCAGRARQITQPDARDRGINHLRRPPSRSSRAARSRAPRPRREAMPHKFPDRRRDDPPILEKLEALGLVPHEGALATRWPHPRVEQARAVHPDVDGPPRRPMRSAASGTPLPVRCPRSLPEGESSGSAPARSPSTTARRAPPARAGSAVRSLPTTERHVMSIRPVPLRNAAYDRRMVGGRWRRSSGAAPRHRVRGRARPSPTAGGVVLDVERAGSAGPTSTASRTPRPAGAAARARARVVGSVGGHGLRRLSADRLRRLEHCLAARRTAARRGSCSACAAGHLRRARRVRRSPRPLADRIDHERAVWSSRSRAVRSAHAAPPTRHSWPCSARAAQVAHCVSGAPCGCARRRWIRWPSGHGRECSARPTRAPTRRR